MIYQFSNIGTNHYNNNAANQDSIRAASNKRYIAISLADGVSTCEEAEAGANIACSALNDLLLNKASFFFQFDEDQIAEVAILHVLFSLKKQAAVDNKDINEYSSTISSVLIDTKMKKALLINLGDGIIIATGNGKAKVLAMPDDSTLGCCVTTTKNAVHSVTVKTVDMRTVDSITVCSDGAWQQMFDKNKMKPEIADYLINNEYERLKEFLTECNCFDDYSFVSVDLKSENGRK